MSWLSEAIRDPVRVSLIVGLSGSFVGLVIGWRQGNVSKAAATAALKSAEAANHTALASGTRAVATARLEWLTVLRNTLAEYHAALMVAKYPLQPGVRQKHCELGTKIDLLLNQDNADQKILWELCDQLYYATNETKRDDLDKPLVEAARKVFKAEWERIKAEMNGSARVVT